MISFLVPISSKEELFKICTPNVTVAHNILQQNLSQVCREKIQLDAATQRFIELIIRSTCFGHYYAHHQELETIQVITARGT